MQDQNQNRSHAPGLRLTAIVAACFPLAGLAQQQQVRPPIAVYWVSAATASGLGAGGTGMAAMMGMALGQGGSSQRTLDLRLGSSQSASGEPRAAHEIPPGLSMGPALPLLGVERVRASGETRGDLPQDMQQPKGRLLIYWGCGEKAGPGQPVVMDFARLGAGQRPPGIAARRVSAPRGPAADRHRAYGEWPNREDSKPVPAGASLRGDHRVQGNYSPEIRFAVGERHDFLAPVSLAATPAGAAMRLQWQRVANATGYFMMAFGHKEGSNDTVMWSSSDVQEMGGALMDYVPPAEVARLIGEKVVLPPERTDCAVPAEVMRAADMPVLQFIAYGDELNVVHPPRPKDPKVTWEQVWAVKLRLKSTAMLPLGEGMGISAQTREAPPARERPEGAPAQESQRKGGAPLEQGVEEGIRTLRGIFGR